MVMMNINNNNINNNNNKSIFKAPRQSTEVLINMFILYLIGQLH